MEALEKINRFFSRLLLWIGGVFLTAMIMLTCGNIFLRLVWAPIPGTYELVGYFGAMAAALVLAHTQVRRGHIAVDVLVNSFSKNIRRFLNVANSALCLVFFGLVVWQIGAKGWTLWQTGEVTESLRIIYYPFVYGTALGCAALALVFLTDLLLALFPKKEVRE